MNREKTALFVRSLLGIVFIVSGLTKAFDSNYFASILTSYGADVLYLLAPVIIFLELLVGLLLLFGILAKYVTIGSIVLVLLFSCVYTYGVVALSATNCGCFGHVRILDSSPAAVYLRNVLIICALLFITKQNLPDTVFIPKSVFFTSIILIFIGAFICGNSFRWHSNEGWQYKRFEPIALSKHILHDFVRTNADSSYMVTVFSYTCSHCLNSIGNIEQYEKFGIVDRVIAIGAEDPESETTFKEIFQPTFTIINYPIEQISKLSIAFPVSFLIKRDTIVGVMEGDVPSAYFFKSKDI